MDKRKQVALKSHQVHAQQRNLCITLVALVVGLTPPEAPASDSNNGALAALRRWATFSRDADLEDVKDVCNEVRANANMGDAQVLDRLLAIIKSEAQTLASRSEALRVASELADDAGAHRILDMMKDILGGLESIRRGEGADIFGIRMWEKHKLLEKFFELAADEWVARLEDQSELLAFSREYYLGRPMKGRKGYDACARVIVGCTAPLTGRRSLALEIIEASNRLPVPERLFVILDSNAIPMLRGLVRAATTARDFNYAAASALAYLGDSGIVADLERLRPMIEDQGPTPKSFLKRWIGQIEVQNPPSKLLKYIAATDADPANAIRQRAWAVRRAHQLGIDAAQIRNAILTHNTNAKTKYERMELPAMKIEASKLGILQASDLPEVEIKDRHRKR